MNPFGKKGMEPRSFLIKLTQNAKKILAVT